MNLCIVPSGGYWRIKREDFEFQGWRLGAAAMPAKHTHVNVRF